MCDTTYVVVGDLKDQWSLERKERRLKHVSGQRKEWHLEFLFPASSQSFLLRFLLEHG